MQLKPPQQKPETLNATMDTLQDLGVKWIRRGFYWESIEKTPGVYDFAEYDRLLKTFKERGISVVGCLFGDNSKYTGRQQEGHAPDGKRPRRLRQVRRRLRRALQGREHPLGNLERTQCDDVLGPPRQVGNSEPYAEEYMPSSRPSSRR